MAGDGVEPVKIYKSKNAFLKAKSISKNYTFIYTSGQFKGRLIEEARKSLIEEARKSKLNEEALAEQAAAGQQFFEFE